MITRQNTKSRGGALVVTLATLTALSLLAAYTLVRVRPRVRMAYQNAAWQEARLAAEAGIDSAMNDLTLNATGLNPGNWTNWQEGTAPPPSPLEPIGTIAAVPKKSLKEAKITKLKAVVAQIAKEKGKPIKKGKGSSGPGSGDDDDDDNSGKGSGTGDDTVDSLLSVLGDPSVATKPLYLDNVRISAAKGLPAEVDVQLWGLEPSSSAHARWYRIRSMGTCPLPPTAYEVPANLDALLRRFSLRNVRPSLKRNDVGTATTIPLPNISRSVEVLVEPILSFELALWTSDRISLGSTGSWGIDSFDSTDASKSLDGLYPGRDSVLAQINGHVATNARKEGDALEKPLIALNGTQVRGAVATNGGDNPNTKEHENISGGVAIDQTRVRDDFSRQMVPLVRPEGEFSTPPTNGVFVTGPTSAPTIYSIHGSLTQLRIAPATADTGAIILLIDGDLNLTKPLIIPPSVLALLYVKGNITFREAVNSGPFNSARARQLVIFGDGAASARQTLQVLGETSVCAAFYGPFTDVTLDGSVNWIGSLNSRSFRTLSGGNGGIHYDESLALVGPTIGFRISRYIEDVRE